MSGSGRWSQVLNVLSAWKSNRNLCNLVLLSAVAGSGSLGRLLVFVVSGVSSLVIVVGRDAVATLCSGGLASV